MEKPTRFWVEYNCKFIASYKSVKACLNFINRKGLQDNFFNALTIVDNNGDSYHPLNGTKLKGIL